MRQLRAESVYQMGADKQCSYHWHKGIRSSVANAHVQAAVAQLWFGFLISFITSLLN